MKDFTILESLCIIVGFFCLLTQIAVITISTIDDKPVMLAERNYSLREFSILDIIKFAFIAPGV